MRHSPPTFQPPPHLISQRRVAQYPLYAISVQPDTHGAESFLESSQAYAHGLNLPRSRTIAMKTSGEVTVMSSHYCNDSRSLSRVTAAWARTAVAITLPSLGSRVTTVTWGSSVTRLAATRILLRKSATSSSV